MKLKKIIIFLSATILFCTSNVRCGQLGGHGHRQDSQASAFSIAQCIDCWLSRLFPPSAVTNPWEAKTAEELKQCLDQNPAKVGLKDEFSRTLLHQAAQENDLAKLSILLDYEADIDAEDNNQSTPLHEAISSSISRPSSKEAAQALIRRGADVNRPAFRGETPLYLASTKPCKAIVTFLLEAGADPNLVVKRFITRESETALTGAARRHASLHYRDHREFPHEYEEEGEQEDILRILLEAGADVDAAKGYVFHCATLAARSTDILLFTLFSAKLDASVLHNVIGRWGAGLSHGCHSPLPTLQELIRRGVKPDNKFLQRIQQEDNFLEPILAARKEYLAAIKAYRTHMMDHYGVPRDVAGLVMAEAGQHTDAMIIP